MREEFDDENDSPLGDNDVDRQIHLSKLYREIEEFLDSGQPAKWSTENDPYATDYTEYLTAFEEEGFGVVPSELLTRIGYSVIPPAELDEDTVTPYLYQIIRGLGRLGLYLFQTDHLRDMELYETLWDEVLREPLLLIPQAASFAWYWSPIGAGDEEDTLIWLAYYASNAERRAYRKDNPEERVPKRRKCPSNRDAKLPKQPEPPKALKRKQPLRQEYLADDDEDGDLINEADFQALFAASDSYFELISGVEDENDDE
jgi:hypothetical protein